MKRNRDLPDDSVDSSGGKRLAKTTPPEPMHTPDFDPVQLEQQTPHPRDCNIKFTEEDHMYYVRFEEEGEFSTDNIMSTSTFIHTFFPHFDADLVLTKMRKSRKWPHSPYFGMTNADIKKQWADNGRVASTRGTKLHFLLECHNNGYALESSPYRHILEVQDYFRWRTRHFAHLVPFRTELRMYTGIDLCLTGTADLLAVDREHPLPADCDHTLSLHLIDWKFSKAIKRENQYEKGFGVCADLDSCNFWAYALQQNIYQWMIETYYQSWVWRGHQYTKVRIVAKHLAIFHRNHGREGLFLALPDMQARVEKMMTVRRQSLQKKE